MTAEAKPKLSMSQFLTRSDMRVEQLRILADGLAESDHPHDAEYADDLRWMLTTRAEFLTILQELSSRARLPNGVVRSKRITFPSDTFHRINAALSRARGEA
jgi:hypothetical protein